MSFVVCYLPCFRQWLITTRCGPSCLSSHLFTDRGEISFLPSPLLQCTFSIPTPSAVLVFSSVVYCSVFLLGGRAGVSLPRGLNPWFIPGVAGGILHDAWHSPVWSAQCLPGRFGASGGDGGLRVLLMKKKNTAC
jgi:hypothetical protein